MQLFKKRFLIASIGAILLPFVVSLTGCGNNDMAKEDPNVTQKRVADATKMRSYFDKSRGNYDSLSAEDKTALNALTGSEAHSREAFTHMPLPGGVGPAPGSQGGLPPSGPGSH